MSDHTMTVRRGADSEVAGIPHTLGSAYALCEQLAQLGDAIPKTLRGAPGKIMAVVKAGAEMGIPPMRAMNSIYLFDGNVIMGAHLMAGLAQSHPDCSMFLVTDGDNEAVAEVRRRSWPEGKIATFRYTMDQARKAGLANKAMWQKHQASMLRARVTGIAARAVFADVMAGVYTRDEGREMEDRAKGGAQPQRQQAPGVVDAEVVSDAPEAQAPDFTGASAKLDERLKAEGVNRGRLNVYLKTIGKPPLPSDVPDKGAAEFMGLFFGHGGLADFRAWDKANPATPAAPTGSAKDALYARLLDECNISAEDFDAYVKAAINQTVKTDNDAAQAEVWFFGDGPFVKQLADYRAWANDNLPAGEPDDDPIPF